MPIAPLYSKLMFFILILIGSFIQPATTLADSLDFDTAWQRVSEKSYVLLAEQANIEHAMHQQDATWDMHLPQVNINAGYIYLDDKIELSPSAIFESMPIGGLIGTQIATLVQALGISAAAIDSNFTSKISDREIKTASIGVLWPIFTGGRVMAAQDIAAASLAEARQQKALKVYDQFELLCTRYYAVSLLTQLLATRTEVVESLKIHLEHAKLLVENGQIAEVEELQAEAAYDKAMVDQEKAANELAITQAALTSLLQEETTVTTSSRLFIGKKLLPPLDVFIKKTLAGYPGLTILDAKEGMATGVVKVEEGKYYPTIALIGDYSLYEEDNLIGELTPDWFVGVVATIPIIDRSGRSGKRLAAKNLVNKVKQLRHQAYQDLTLLVEKNYRQVVLAEAEYRGLASSLKLAEKALELRELAFDQGLATSLDVVDSRLYVAAVKTQRSHAAYSYVTKLARILAISGDLDKFSSYQNSTL